MVPHPDDPAPSPLLANVPGGLRHPTRVARPAVRRGWLEGGPGPADGRGREEFVELDWDEALDLLAAELNRVRREHGNEAIFGGSYGWASAGRFHHAQSQLHRFLNTIGGFTGSRNSYSNGTSTVLLPHLVGSADAVLRAASSWPTIVENTELIVAFGGIPAKNVFVTPGGVFTQGRDARGWLVHLYAGWRADLVGRGIDVPTFEEFWAAGEYRLPAGPSHYTLFERFRADPDANPLATPSGRIEIVSATVGSFGYPDCAGHPVWLEPTEWLGAPQAAVHPLHLIANQPSTRLHSQLDGGAVSQAAKIAGREAVRIHPTDAAARGIAGGDVVRVFNERGGCLAGAVLTDDLRPGVVQLPTGAWFDPLDDHPSGPLCVHGNPNVLTADVPTSRLSQGCVGQHALVEIKRWVGELPPLTVAASPPGTRPWSARP